MTTLRSSLLWVAALLYVGVAPAYGLTIDLIVTPEDPKTVLPPALLAPSSGISIVPGSATFVGRVGDGVDANTAQSATYSGFNLVSPNGLPTITNPQGIFLTSGTANIPFTNTEAAFSPVMTAGTATEPGTGGDADLSAILMAAGAPSSLVNDVNSLTFRFVVAPGQTSVSAKFVVGSDEFPDQEVTDVFAFIVDGVNYARFQDGSLVSFLTGANAGNFNDNDVDTGNYPLEYDGISNSLDVVGLLNPALSEHTLKIAIADTEDDVFDSGVFIGALAAGTAQAGGINPGSRVPEPATLILLGTGLAALAARYTRKRNSSKSL
ncbi:MAG: choice-of-anchor L domain-containing protein [Candidatus Limnocylindria bacterium]